MLPIGTKSIIKESVMTMRSALFIVGIVAACSFLCPSSSNSGAAARAVSVLEHHNSPRRTGVYVDPMLTRASAAAFHIDPSFKARVPGAIYAQLLYVARGVDGKDVVIAATEENNVAALDAATGKTLWTRHLGEPVPLSQLRCGNIDPLGVTGTPVIDMASRMIFLDAMTTPDHGRTKRHLVFALSLDDGSTLPGWPVDISAKIRAFDSAIQNQRGALAYVGGTVYIPYGGHYGDCGSYHGWLVGIPAANPSRPKAWATFAPGGGCWAPGGVASENGALFIATGNTFGATAWAGGEALLRFRAGPVFSGRPADYFTPSDWHVLDVFDIDLGGTGPIIVDVPGSRPSRLLVGLGKDRRIYLVDKTDMGGVGHPVAVEQVSRNAIIGAAASYATKRGTYVVFKGRGIDCPAGQSGDLTAVRIVPGAPPRVQTAWCAQQNGMGSPMVTTTDGHSEAIVWSVGAEGDNRLHGFDGDTGRIVYAGGGPNDVIGRVRRYHTPILAGGRIYVAADDTVRAFVR
jgi:outer membrane protein assembly factor BamB